MVSSQYPGESSGCEQAEQAESQQGPVIRDNRRIDPDTGRVRQQASPLTPPDPDYRQAQPGSMPPGQAQPGQGMDQPYETVFPGAGYPSTGVNEAGAAQPTAYTNAAKAAYSDNSGQPARPTPPATPPQQDGSAGAPAEQAQAGTAQEHDQANQQLAERTADLQRVNAEYANYRKRVERERDAVRQQGVASVATSLLPLLDDVDRAREHGDLTGGFKSVGESLERVLQGLGVSKFGEAGEVFDPSIHEAMMHSLSDQVSQTTAVQILQPGYKLGEQLLRPARVAVADPQE